MSPRADAPTFRAVAERAVMVSFGTAIDEATHAAVLALDRAIAADPVPGLSEVVPAYVNLLVVFDPLLTDHSAVIAALRRLLDGPAAAPGPVQRREVLVCYDGELAPDLDAVAARTGLSREAVIAAHLAGDYRVFLYGFAPGYAYLAGVPPALRLDRKTAPQRDVPAGSVMIAGPQCLVSTLLMPSGWWLIGRSPTRILGDDPARPFLFDVGDTVVFRRIDRAAFERARHG